MQVAPTTCRAFTLSIIPDVVVKKQVRKAEIRRNTHLESILRTLRILPCTLCKPPYTTVYCHWRNQHANKLYLDMFVPPDNSISPSTAISKFHIGKFNCRHNFSYTCKLIGDIDSPVIIIKSLPLFHSFPIMIRLIHHVITVIGIKDDLWRRHRFFTYELLHNDCSTTAYLGKRPHHVIRR